MTPNLPPHLQEKMDEASMQYRNSGAIGKFYRICREAAFKAGYQQAYSDILQELGPVVSVLNGLSCKCPYICCCGYDDAQPVLKHLKERILNDTK